MSSVRAEKVTQAKKPQSYLPKLMQRTKKIVQFAAKQWDYRITTQVCSSTRVQPKNMKKHLKRSLTPIYASSTE